MHLLELIYKSHEGTFHSSLCVSERKDALEARIAVEREKLISSDDYHNYPYLLRVGHLEEYLDKIRTQAQMIDGIYHMEGVAIGHYPELRAYMMQKAQPFASYIGIEESVVRDVVNGGFYESARFTIREIETI